MNLQELEEIKTLKKREKSKRYYETHKKHIKEYCKMWNREHKDYISKKTKEIYQLNRELNRCVRCHQDNDCSTSLCSKCKMKDILRRKEMKGGKCKNEIKF
jgi:hypothetical protein